MPLLRRTKTAYQPAATVKMPNQNTIYQPVIPTDCADIVIVGNGIAGFAAAMEAREHAPHATISLVTDQNYPTINTPALKQFGRGVISLEQLLAYPAESANQLHLAIIHGRVTRLHPQQHHILLGTGEKVTYGKIVLATGTYPVRFADTMPGRTLDGVIYLHTLEHYLDLRRRMPEVNSAIVIGGGYHAAETALLLAHQKITVHWLIRRKTVVNSQLDSAASDMILDEVQRAGVHVHRETEIAQITGYLGKVTGVVVNTGEHIRAQLVVGCVGVKPDLSLAARVEHKLTCGIPVDEHLQTSSPDVYAVGSVACIRDPQTGQHTSRGQWYTVFHQGRYLGAALAGAYISEASARGALGAFWHTTRLERLNIVTVGLTVPPSGYEVHTTTTGDNYRRVVLKDDKLVGYLSAGTDQPSGIGLKTLIDEQVDVRGIWPKMLTDNFDLRSFLMERHLDTLIA